MNTKTYADWQALASSLSYPTQAFINGQFCDSANNQSFTCISPRDNSELCRISACDEQDVDLAVKAARDSFNTGIWANQTAKERKTVLLKLANLMQVHAHELALLDTLDMGMTISDSTQGNIPGAIECIQWYAELIDKLYDEIAPTSNNAITRIHKVPLGVIAAITPWNYPLLIACWKIAPALAAGNSVILKPAEQSSLSALKLAELAKEAGIPDGVFNVVPGFGQVTGKALGLHPDVDAIAFTGSSRVGGLYMQYAGQSNLKRVYLECGGKTPNIVLSSCTDLDKAAQSIALGAFSNQGQICNAGTRLIVDNSIKQRLIEKVLTHSKSYRPADPLDPAAKISCLVNIEHKKNVQNYIDSGLKQGAELILGQGTDNQQESSCFIQPCIFDAVDQQMDIAQNEIFGPVLSIIAIDNIDQAIAAANNSIYGLGAGIWTDSIKEFEYAAKKIQAGVIWNNCHDHGDISSPVGGFKQSGFGRDKSIHAIDKYVEYKTIWINLD